MKRRDFIALLAATTASAPFSVRAQKSRPVIAILGSGAADTASSRLQMSQLDAGMRDVGLIAGRDYVFDIRWAGSDATRVAPLARELLANKPRAVVVSTNLAAIDVQKLSRKVPIVGTGLNAPTAVGLAASLARPGGNVTGVATMAEDTQLKLLDMLHETFSGIRRVLAITNMTNPSHRPMLDVLKSKATQDAIAIDTADVTAPGNLDAAFAQLARQRASAVFLFTDNGLFGLAEPIVSRALAMRVPTVGCFSEPFARAGGLYAYSRDPREAFQGVARLLKKILDGADPAEIPFEQPTRFNLYINLKTARALGIEVPETLLAIADGVIE